MDQPRIFLPDGFLDKSGLYLPAETGAADAEGGLPPELAPQIDLIVAGAPPGFLDQVLAYATEEELGFDVTPSDVVVAITEQVSFWPSIRFLSRFQRDLWNGRTEQRVQAIVLDRWFGGSNFATRAKAWMGQGPRRVLFSEQQLFALQRLILLNAQDGPVEADFTPDEYRALVMALAAVPGSLLTPGIGVSTQPTPVEDEEWMRFFVGHGGFVGRGAIRNELGRADRLYRDIASSSVARGHHSYCPLDDWLLEAYDLSFEELQAFAFSLHAASKMLETEELPSLVDASYFKTSVLADKAQQALDVVSAPREWYVERFQQTQSDERRAVFEITPFLQQPALRQPDGKVMPIAPRALEAWMGATGNHYRFLDLARKKSDATRSRFSTFSGFLLETYVAESVENAYPPRPPSTMWLPGTVHRDFAYPATGGERRTPDVAIDLTPDLVLIEVTSSRLTEKSIVDADPDAVRADIQKVLVEKIEQLGARIADIRERVVEYPGINIDEVERIWPIVVSSEGLFQTPTLWAHIRPHVDAALGQPKIQPLTLFDVEDLEDLLGLVMIGNGVVEILRDKTTEHWRELEFAAWFRGRGHQRYPPDSPLARAQFDAATERAVRTLFGDEGLARYRAQPKPSDKPGVGD